MDHNDLGARRTDFDRSDAVLAMMLCIALAGPAGAADGSVLVTGVRGSQLRTIANSPVPIDIISAVQITATGKTGLKENLSSLIPSLTLPAQNGGGTSASAQPYTVRGLTGDYVLVLINGKRRHSTALINNLATIGELNAALHHEMGTRRPFPMTLCVSGAL